MAIAFTINPEYMHPITVAISSILVFNKGLIDIYILSASFPEEMTKRLHNLEEVYPNLTLHLIIVDDEKFLTSNFYLSESRFTAEICFRLLLPLLLPQHDKVLYLDADIIVTGNLQKLWETPLDGYCFAGAKDYYNTHKLIGHLGFTPNDLYINSGVLLMNLKKLREENATHKLIKLVIENKFYSLDQDAINIYAKGRVKRFSDCFNVQLSTLIANPFSFLNAYIVHYSGDNKPWKSNKHDNVMTLWWHAHNRNWQKKYDQLTTNKF